MKIRRPGQEFEAKRVMIVVEGVDGLAHAYDVKPAHFRWQLSAAQVPGKQPRADIHITGPMKRRSKQIPEGQGMEELE